MIEDKALWNSLPVPSVLVGSDDRICEANLEAETFLNLSMKNLTGCLLSDKLFIDPAIDAAMARARAQQSSIYINEVEIGSHARSSQVCNIAIAPLNAGGGSLIIQIRPLEVAQRMLQANSPGRAAKSAIGMAEMLAHEIKNPLAGITGAAQLLSMTLSAEDREMTDLIVAESRRIVKLLDQVEQFGNHSAPRLQPVNIHDVLDRARKSASVGYAAHMMFVEDFDPSLPRTNADADQLVQVVLNLLKNAAEAGGNQITLRSYYDASLRTRRDDGTFARLPLQVEVIDDGPGLPPVIADSIFEPFVSGRENGTGLGLALVSKLIGDMGGWISVTSEPGHTVFRLSLPRAADGPIPHGDT